jgi:hypothetical protein
MNHKQLTNVSQRYLSLSIREKIKMSILMKLGEESILDISCNK